MRAGSARKLAAEAASADSFLSKTFAGLQPSIISGAGLVSIIKEGKIGNAKVGTGEWLVIEADESDGSIVQYEAEIGLLLNVDKDHQEINELMNIFSIFKNNSKKFIVNQSNVLAKQLSQNIDQDFSTDENLKAGYIATDFKQEGFSISFNIQHLPTGQAGSTFNITTIGKHNMENALAAVTVANQIGVDLQSCAASLKNYEGIYRRNQVLGNKNGIWVIDDYAHNPVKCAAAIKACQPVAGKVVADLRLARWFSAAAPDTGDDDIFCESEPASDTIRFVQWSDANDFQVSLLNVLCEELKLSELDDARGFNRRLGATEQGAIRLL